MLTRIKEILASNESPAKKIDLLAAHFKLSSHVADNVIEYVLTRLVQSNAKDPAIFGGLLFLISELLGKPENISRGDHIATILYKIGLLAPNLVSSVQINNAVSILLQQLANSRLDNKHIAMVMIGLGKLAKAAKCPDLTSKEDIINALLLRLSRIRSTEQDIGSVLYSYAMLCMQKNINITKDSPINILLQLASKLDQLLSINPTFTETTEMSANQFHFFLGYMMTVTFGEDLKKCSDLYDKFTIQLSNSSFRPESSKTHQIYLELLQGVMTQRRFDQYFVVVSELPVAGHYIDITLQSKTKKNGSHTLIGIEIKGDSHFEDAESMQNDALRQTILERQGWTVLNFNLIGTIKDDMKKHIETEVIPLVRAFMQDTFTFGKPETFFPKPSYANVASGTKPEMKSPRSYSEAAGRNSLTTSPKRA